jgi:hypothetical protein
MFELLFLELFFLFIRTILNNEIEEKIIINFNSIHYFPSHLYLRFDLEGPDQSLMALLMLNFVLIHSIHLIAFVSYVLSRTKHNVIQIIRSSLPLRSLTASVH